MSRDFNDQSFVERTVDQAIESFLRFVAEERRLESSTVFHYSHDLKLFRRFIERVEGAKASSIPLSRLSLRHVQAFLDDQTYRRGNSPSSNRRRLACLRGFLRHAGYQLTETPNVQLTLPRIDPTIPAILSKAEAEALLSAARTSAPNPVRDYAIFRTFLDCGCRLSELLRLRPEDVDLEANLITFTQGNDDHRDVPLRPETRDALAAYLAQRPRVNTPELFINRLHQRITKGAVYHSFYRCLAAANLLGRNLRIHSLRHTCLKRLLEEGHLTQEEIRELAGTRTDSALKPHLPDRTTDPKRTD